MNFSFINPKFIIAVVTLLSSCNPGETVNASKNDLQLLVPEKSEYDSTIFEPIYYKLKSGDSLSKAEIDDFAGNIATRSDFYSLLAEFHKESLFPVKYNTFETAAESNMVHWLVYPTELDTVPSKIEVVKKIDFLEHDTAFIYYVLQFKTEEPHWAAKDGWMIGVVGPYFKNSKPYDWTTGTFSRFTKATETTPEKEVEWIHNNVFRRSPE